MTEASKSPCTEKFDALCKRAKMTEASKSPCTEKFDALYKKQNDRGIKRLGNTEI